MKRFFSIILTVVFSLPLSSGFVRAADLNTVGDAAQADFETRRAALVAVFELTESEIRDLQSRLSLLERPVDVELAFVYDTIEDSLKDYLDLTASRVDELNSGYITLAGVLTTANNLNNWRRTVYDPGTRELFDFLILQQGRSILATVEARYEKVATDVKNLKVSLTPERGVAFEKMLQDARGRVENAKLLSGEAYAKFMSSFRLRHGDLIAKLEKIQAKRDAAVAPVELTASVIDTVASTSPAKPATILDTLDLTKETVQSLMKRAVDEIAETYKIFLQMRDLVHQK